MTTPKPALPEPRFWFDLRRRLICATWRVPASETSKPLWDDAEVRAAIEAAVAEARAEMQERIDDQLRTIKALMVGMPDEGTTPVIRRIAWLEQQLAEARAETEALKSDIADALTTIAVYEAEARAAPEQPIDMILHCPACGMQHIDAPEFNGTREDKFPAFGEDPAMSWTNPPHRSHLCHGCGHIWRPADVPTNGVAAIKTKGKADSAAPEPQGQAVPDQYEFELLVDDEWQAGGQAATLHEMRAEASRYVAQYAQDGAVDVREYVRYRIATAPPPTEQAQQAPMCQCGDRPASKCPEPWEPGCDLGANKKYVRVHQSSPEELAAIQRATQPAEAPAQAGGPIRAKRVAAIMRLVDEFGDTRVSAAQCDGNNDLRVRYANDLRAEIDRCLRQFIVHDPVAPARPSEDARDAERYRWLRSQHTYDGEGDSDIRRWYVQAGREPVPCDPGALDAAIDAARALGDGGEAS